MQFPLKRAQEDSALRKLWLCTAQNKCSRRTIAKALFIKSGKHISLTIFDDKLVTLHNIYNSNLKVEDSSNFNEENVTQLLLSVEATVFYNNKN